MNKIAKSVVQGTPVGTGVGMRPETLDLEIDDLYELSSPNVSMHIRRLRPYVSAWEADRKARIEIEQAYSDLQDEHMVLHQELGAAQTRIGALEAERDEALAEVELQTQHSLTSWVLDAVLRLGWKPPALAEEEKPGNASCGCVFSAVTGRLDTTGCSLHGLGGNLPPSPRRSHDKDKGSEKVDAGFHMP